MPKEKLKVGDVFKRFDVDGDIINKKAMGRFVQHRGPSMSAGEISRLVDLVDVDGNGNIDVLELRSALGNRATGSSPWSRPSKKWTTKGRA